MHRTFLISTFQFNHLISDDNKVGFLRHSVFPQHTRRVQNTHPIIMYFSSVGFNDKNTEEVFVII